MKVTKVAEVLYGAYKNSPQAQRYIKSAKEAIKKGTEAGNKFINSVWTEGLKGTIDGGKKVLTSLGVVGGTASAANAANQNQNKNKNQNKNNTNKPYSFKQFIVDATKFYASNTPLGYALKKKTPEDLVDVLLAFIPYGKALPIAKKAISIMNKGGAKAAGKYLADAVATARQTLVKASPKAAKKISNGVKEVQSSIDALMAKKFYPDKTRVGDVLGVSSSIIGNKLQAQAVHKAATQGIGKLTDAESKSFAKLIRENTDKLGQLAKDVGVTKKSEIPNLLKFAKELGDIIKNSPNFIKSKANLGKGTVGFIGNIGLSVYDLYQAFKENDNTLIPKSVANAGRIGASFIKGNTIMKLLYGGLGYVAGDKLSKAALEKLGVKRESTPEQQNEYDTGMAYPDLEAYVPEYLTGQSGRKYHVVGDKIYAFDTGRAVNVNEALTDADNYFNTQRQKNEDKLAIVNQQIADLQRAEQSGYAVPQEVVAQAYNERDAIISELNNQPPSYNVTANDYNTEEDLADQYFKRVVEPQQQVQQAQQVKQQQDYTKVYQDLFTKIANDTFADLDNYYKPENQAIDYYQYMTQVALSKAPYMSPEEFSRVSKLKAMQQIAPVIRDKALNQLNSLIKQQQDYELKMYDYALKERGQVETERDNRAKNFIDWFKAKETQRSNMSNEGIDAFTATETKRHNLAKENIDEYGAYTDRQQANAQSMNAMTNRMEIPIKQGQLELNRQSVETKKQLVPFQQANYAGQAVMNAGMSGLTMDQFLNSNQSVMSQVFPGTTGQNQQYQYDNFKLGK